MQAPHLIQQYDAAETPRGFLYHAVRAWRAPGVVFGQRTLTSHFFLRDLQSRFRGSMLGGFWVLMQPLFQFAIYFTVFGMFFGRWEDKDTVLFALWLFSGIICFHGMVSGVGSAMNSIVSNANLVKKVAFPSEMLPVVPVMVEAAVLLVGLGVVLLIGGVTGRLSFGWNTLAIPWAVANVLLFSAGLGLLLANLTVFVRDVKNIWQFASTAWLFLSPNFWWPDFLYGREPWVFGLLGMNPFFHTLVGMRQAIGLVPETLEVDGRIVHNLGITTTLVESLSIGSGWAVLFLVVGYGTFMVHRDKHADLV